MRTAPGPRVHAVGSKQFGPAYDRLPECGLRIGSLHPHLGAFNEALLEDGDVVLVGCSDTMLLTPAFQRRVRRIVKLARVVAIVVGGSEASAGYAAQNGFHGFARRESEPVVVERTVRAVSDGELAFPRATLSALVQLHRRLTPLDEPEDAGEMLTPRQQQIVALIARGATDREIAEMLRISRSTAHKHVQNALRRTNARTRSQLAAGTRGPAVNGGMFGLAASVWPMLQPPLKGKGAKAG